MPETKVDWLRDLLVNFKPDVEANTGEGATCLCKMDDRKCKNLENWLTKRFSLDKNVAVFCGRKSRVYVFEQVLPGTGLKAVKRISLLTEKEKNKVEHLYELASNEGVGPRILETNQSIELSSIPKSDYPELKEEMGKQGKAQDKNTYYFLCMTLEACKEVRNTPRNPSDSSRLGFTAVDVGEIYPDYDLFDAEKCAELFQRLSKSSLLVLDLDGNFMQNHDGKYVVTDFDEETSLLLEDLSLPQKTMLGVLNACSSNQASAIRKYMELEGLLDTDMDMEENSKKRKETIQSYSSLCHKIDLPELHKSTLRLKLVSAFLQLNNPGRRVTETEATGRITDKGGCEIPDLAESRPALADRTNLPT